MSHINYIFLCMYCVGIESSIILTLEYLITVSHLLNVHNGKLHMASKEGIFDVVELMVNEQFKKFSINVNAQHVNGMTPFDLTLHMYGY